MAGRDQGRISSAGRALDGSLQKKGMTGLCQDGSPCSEAKSHWQWGCSFAFSPYHAPRQWQTLQRGRHKQGLGPGRDSHY